MAGPADEQIWTAVDAFENEWEQWGLRVNKAGPNAPHEVFRLNENGEPVVQTYCWTHEIGEDELKGQRAFASIKAAFASVEAR